MPPAASAVISIFSVSVSVSQKSEVVEERGDVVFVITDDDVLFVVRDAREATLIVTDVIEIALINVETVEASVAETKRHYRH